MIPPTKTILPEDDAQVPHGEDKPASNDQLTELRALAEKHGEAFDGNLTQAQARDRIEWLKGKDA